MKNIFKTLFCLAAVSAALVSCKESYEPYEWGEEDAAGCYGVYFPAQNSSLTLEPTDPTTATIAVARTVTNGAITVPVSVSDTSGIFTVSQLSFADGQKESSITLNFDKSAVGVTYSVSLEITDPQYASKYNDSAIALDFDVTREKWNDLGKGTWYEYGYFEFEAPVPVTILQNDSNHNLYRVEMKENGEAIYSEKQDTYFEFKTVQKGENIGGVSITTSGLVYFSIYSTGYYNSNYPSAPIWFVHPGNFSSLASEANYAYNKVLQYQSDGTTPAAVQIAPYYYINGVGGWNYTQQDGVISIVFPGAVLTDYSIDVAAGETTDGVVPVSLTLGADVANVKYAVYEGSLSATQVSNKANGIVAGTEENISEYKPVEGANVFGVELAATGVYTIVAVSYDAEGNAQNSASAEFTYVASADEEAYATVVNAGIELTSRYEASGYDKRNSAQFYVYGKDITDAKVGLYKTSTVESYGMEAVVAAVMESESLDAAAIEEVNNGGYADVMTGLAPLTSYTLVVWATNGYTSTAVTAEVTTEGLDRIKMTTGTYTYVGFWEGEDPGYDFYQDPNYENTYVIPSWGGGVDFTFTFDPATKKVVVPTQAVGYTYGSYGPVYVGEAKNVYSPTKYQGYADLIDSYYDEVNNTFNFQVAYFVSGGSFGVCIETFKLDEAVKFGAEATTTALYKGVNVRSTDKQLSKGHISLEMDAPANISCPAGIKAEWEGASVQTKMVSVDSANLQKAAKTVDFSKETISLR